MRAALYVMPTQAFAALYLVQAIREPHPGRRWRWIAFAGLAEMVSIVTILVVIAARLGA